MEQAKSNFDTYISSHIAILKSIAEDDHMVSLYQCYNKGEIDNIYKYENLITNSIKDARDNHYTNQPGIRLGLKYRLRFSPDILA